MKTKTKVRVIIGILAAVIVVFAAVYFMTGLGPSDLLALSGGFFSSNITGIIILFSFAVVLMMLFPFIHAWYIRKTIGVLDGRGKIFTVKKSLAAAREWLKENRGLVEDIFLYDQLPEPPTADTPFVTFLFTTERFKDYPTRDEAGADDRSKLFINVNRKTNEVACNSNVKTWDRNLEFLDRMRLIAVPFSEKKKDSEYERLVKEKLLGGFAEEKGKQAASDKKDEKEGEKK